jgi:multiple sugar transport system substrate-binding protein
MIEGVQLTTNTSPNLSPSAERLSGTSRTVSKRKTALFAIAALVSTATLTAGVANAATKKPAKPAAKPKKKPATATTVAKTTAALPLAGSKLALYGFASSEAEDSALTGLLGEFNTKTGAKAEFFPQKEYDTALQAALASGSGPDVFYVDSFKMPDLLKAGALAPVPDGVLTQPEDIYPSLRSVFSTPDGKLVCPPKDFSTLALVYDKDFLKAKGVTPPTTWDELKAAAAKLTTDGRTGLVMGFEYPRVGVFMFQAGGAMTDEKFTKMTVSSPENKAAFGVLSEMYKAKSLQSPDEVGAGWGGEAFGKQKAAMTIEGNWIVGALKKDFPTVNAGYAELPAGPKGKGTFAFTVCYGVNKNSKNQSAAWKLVDFLTSPEGSLKWTNAFNVMPAHASVKDKWLAARPELKPFVDGAAYARKFQFVPGFGDVQGEFNKGLKDVFSGKTTFDDYAASVDKAGNSVLKG